MKHSEQVQRAARAMLADFDTIMSEITDRVWARIPVYASILYERSELREQVGHNVKRVILCLAEGHGPTEEDLAQSRSNGERRALQGIEQSAIIRSFRLAERALREIFDTHANALSLAPEAMSPGRRELVANLDALEEAMLDGYAAMQRRITADNALTEPSLVNRLAQSASVDASEVLHLARSLGIADAAGTRFIALCAALLGPHDAVELQRTRHHLVSELSALVGTAAISGVVTTRAGTSVLLFILPWPHSSERLLPHVDRAIGRHALRVEARAAIGEPRAGLAHVGASCRQALETLEATAHRAQAGETVLYRDTLLEILVSRDPELAHDLSERYLHGLSGHEFLLETLRAYVAADLSIIAAAAALRVHKNTVAYRLGRIQKITGLDVNSVQDLVRVVLALGSERT